MTGDEMRDSRTMERRVISKLAEVDPTFVEMVQTLYGDGVDPRELWDLSKAIPDQADVNAKKSAKKRKAIAGGLLLGTAAESLGTAQAASHALKAYKKPVVPNIPESVHPKPAAAAGLKGALKRVGSSPHAAAGGFALQAVNLGVGLAAAHELLKKPKDIHTMPKSKKVDIGKSKAAVARGVGYRGKRVIKPAVKQAVTRVEVEAANRRAAKTGQRVVVGSAILGSTAGGYAATKKFRARPVKPVPPQESAVKKNEEIEYTWEGDISKVDQDKRLVFGWCSLSKVDGQPVVDLQGDYIPIEETETSAYRYVIESRKGGDMHRRVSKFDQDAPLHTADLVESMVFTPEKLSKMGLAPDALPHGWWIGMKVNDDEQWANVKNGSRLGFSIHGKGRRVEKAL